MNNINVKFVNGIFQFYDSNNRLIGGFTIKDLIQFIIGVKIFNNINQSEANDIIEQFILSRENKCHFKSHDNSPFMGNVGLLIILNNEFLKYKEKSFETDLALFNEKIQRKIEFVINRSLYEFSNYMLLIFDTILNEIKKDPQKIKIISDLHTCSIKILHQMNICLYNEVKMLSKKYYKLKNRKEIQILEKTISEKPILEKQISEKPILEKSKVTLIEKKPKIIPIEKDKVVINDEQANRYIETSEYVS